MAVTKKNRRKLIRDGRLFIWWVAVDYDSPDMLLHIVSEDGRFVVHYVLGQPVGDGVLVVIGREFAGAETGGVHTRFRCPAFDVGGVIRPAGVRGLIDWCLTSEEPRRPLAFGEYRWHGYGSRPTCSESASLPPQSDAPTH